MPGKGVPARKSGRAKRPRAPKLDDEAICRFLRGEGRQWLDDPNIVGIGLAEKEQAGVETGTMAVRFDVIGKLGLPDIVRAGSRPIPDRVEIGGLSLPTDVKEAWPEAQASAAPDRKSKFDPLLGGISVGTRADAGTLGTILWHKSSAQPVGLSNWHILANDRSGGTIFQPGPEGGTAQLSPAGHLRDQALDIDLDAAIMTIRGRAVSGEIAGLGVTVTGTCAALKGMRVIKSGKQTEVTYGRIVNLHKIVSYRIFGLPQRHSIIVFVIEADPERPPQRALSTQGDSGSCWMRLDDAGRPTGEMVGLHVAGDPGAKLAYACHAEKVFERFELEALGARRIAAARAPASAALWKQGINIHRVIARDGLAVHAGPAPEFPEKESLSFGTEVSVISQHGGWSLVDLQGDGKADGFMLSALLKPVGDS